MNNYKSKKIKSKKIKSKKLKQKRFNKKKSGSVKRRSMSRAGGAQMSDKEIRKKIKQIIKLAKLEDNMENGMGWVGTEKNNVRHRDRWEVVYEETNKLAKGDKKLLEEIYKEIREEEN